ncbi:MAG TPA: 2-oxoglutarate dehydrogenase complex dihydrolipoyllysine-residue succinyltransferase [Gemmataceae bacterium]|nr:2-oxoglutarate dehydrogenase complex dihydrolipoyllysine-residue succinyltransferase [Gemmataceae bacterium]
MAVNIVVPSVGESITEGTLAQWLKKDGDAVRADEPVLELETEKATTSVPAPSSGRLVIAVPQGQTVKIGQVVGRVEEGAAPPRPAPAPARQEVEPAPPPAPKEAVLLSPAARQRAADAGIDATQLSGTGRGGRVTKQDVLTFLEKQPAPSAMPTPPSPIANAPPPPEGERTAKPQAAPRQRETRQRMTSIRQRIAERLVAAQHSAAILTTFNEADMSAVMALRAKYKEAFQKKHGVGLGFMSFFVKACVEALRAFPAVNARLDGADVVYHNYCNIGVAVSTERGLMVPVLRDAHDLSLAQVERGVAELAEKARSGKISVDDLQGGTFTITNGGVFGSLLSTPLLNTPQTGILGMHLIQKRPVAIDDQVVIRPMMYLALSYDHRLIDGREAVSFLLRVKECVEGPERLLLEV